MEDLRLSEFYLEYKPMLFSLAYRMLGSVSDAEDLVQDVFVQLSERELAHERNVRSLLCTMVTHRSIDQLRSARKKRESYVGTWIPEPLVLTETDPLEEVMRDDAISLAVLFLLEQLNPVERAVFVLREVLDFEYAAIAQMIGKEESNCRKIHSRAKKKVSVSPEQADEKRAGHAEVTRSFIAALGSGNVQRVIDLLAPDVTYYGDGGGKVTAALRPIHSQEQVSRLLSGLAKTFAKLESTSIEIVNLNGETGVIMRVGGHVYAVIGFGVEDGKIKQIFTILNPDKIGRLERMGQS